MTRTHEGFTLIELMIVVAILGVLAAIAIPNFIAMQNRAKEGSTKANMHAVQLTAEDYSIQHDGTYADAAGDVVALLPSGGNNFRNPFSNGLGVGDAWEDRSDITAAPIAVSGITSYADSLGLLYNVKGYGKISELSLVLSSGR